MSLDQAPPLLRGENLACIVDGRTLFEDLQVAVFPGEVVGVLGPSGSGKSSLLALLTGLARPAAGLVTLDGRPVDGPVPASARVGVVLQGYGLVSVLTAQENVEIVLRAAGLSPATAATGAAAVLEDLALGPHRHQLADELSGGQQQRVALARALALRPKLIVADEPTAELDAKGRALVLSRLIGAARSGAAAVIATHDPDVASACDRVVRLAS
jgi:putative ABC transport system ATP-binding protein